MNETRAIDVRISYLVGEHIFKQVNDSERYQMTDLGVMLKENCLNYDDGLDGRKRVLTVDDLAQANLLGTANEEAVKKFFENNQVFIDGGSA